MLAITALVALYHTPNIQTHCTTNRMFQSDSLATQCGCCGISYVPIIIHKAKTHQYNRSSRTTDKPQWAPPYNYPGGSSHASHMSFAANPNELGIKRHQLYSVSHQECFMIVVSFCLCICIVQLRLWLHQLKPIVANSMVDSTIKPNLSHQLHVRVRNSVTCELIL